jgi:hypothetical protein
MRENTEEENEEIMNTLSIHFIRDVEALQHKHVKNIYKNSKLPDDVRDIFLRDVVLSLIGLAMADIGIGNTIKKLMSEVESILRPALRATQKEYSKYKKENPDEK